MQIISEPATRTVELKNIELGLSNGQTLNVTLWPEDRFEEDEREFRIHYAANPKLGRVLAEDVTVYRSQVLWISRRTRTVTEKIKEADQRHAA